MNYEGIYIVIEHRALINCYFQYGVVCLNLCKEYLNVATSRNTVLTSHNELNIVTYVTAMVIFIGHCPSVCLSTLEELKATDQILMKLGTNSVLWRSIEIIK